MCITSVMHMQSCFFFAVRLHRCKNSLLLSSRDFATIGTGCHTFPLYFSGVTKSWSMIRYNVFFCNACTFFTTSFPCFVIWKLKKKQTLFSLSETKPSEDCIVPVKLNKAVLIRNQHFSDPERDIRCFILAKYL